MAELNPFATVAHFKARLGSYQPSVDTKRVHVIANSARCTFEELG